MDTLEDCVYIQSDSNMQHFANTYLGYNHHKGLDFIARFHGKFIIGEAKFLSDFGGYQNAQFNDALSTLLATLKKTQYSVIKIAIMDGVLYIPGRNRMHLNLIHYSSRYPIMSALVLRDFLYSL